MHKNIFSTREYGKEFDGAGGVPIRKEEDLIVLKKHLNVEIIHLCVVIVERRIFCYMEKC